MSLFTYLHTHTYFSQGGGPASPEEWCLRASELGYKVIGIADRAPMAGFPRFDVAARSSGLTPIYGVEVDLLLPGSSKSTPLVQSALLFACDHNGLSNLARVCSLAYEGWPGVEAGVTWERLSAHAQGLLVVLLGGDEAGAFSPVVSLAPKKKNELGSILRGIFDDRAFLGVPHSGRPGDGTLAAQVVRAAGEIGLSPVALPTARYLGAEDAPSYEALRLARQKAGWPRESALTAPTTGSTTSDRPGPHFLRPPGEAAALFAEWPETLENLARIVALCAGANRLPQGTEHIHGEEVASLAQLAERKLLDVTGTADLSPAVRERLHAEVAASERSGRVGSWLALASLRDIAARDFQDHAPVPLGTTLGMAEDSLLAYAFGLSSLDPAPYSPPRWPPGDSPLAPLPGVEVPASKRAALVSALVKEHGPNRTAYAACATDITPAAAVTASALILGIEKEVIRQLSEYKSWADLKEYTSQAQDPALGRAAALASSLEGAPIIFKPDYDTLLVAPRSLFSASVIADWLPVISPQAGPGWVPWSEEALCTLAYPALSVIPSNPLSALDAGLALARRYPTSGFPPSLDPNVLPDVTEQVAQLFTEGRLDGIPYISSASMAHLQGEITPSTLALTVARSLTGGISLGKEGIAIWEEATHDTGGLLVYKDQLDLLLSSLIGSEQVVLSEMRAILRDGSDVARSRFTSICEVSGLEADNAEALWLALSKKGVALLSRSSAHTMGRIALWSATLKTHHPAALLAGALDAAWERGARNEIRALVEEAQRLGISVRPPDVDRGSARFNLERDGTGWAITWGLGRLPGWNLEVADRLVGVRPAAGFTSFSELVRLGMRARLEQGHIETLVRAGGCDNLGGTSRSRNALLETLNGTITEHVSNGANGPADMFINAPTPGPPLEEAIRGGQSTPRERYLQRNWEVKNLGLGFTQAPEIDDLHRALEDSGDLKGRLLSTTKVGADRIGQSVSLVGLLTSLELIKRDAAPSRNDGDGDTLDADATRPNTMSVAWLEDMEGSIELVAFPPNYTRHQELWTENSLVIVTARVRTHENGDIYLLCEHLAPFHVEAIEEGFSIKVKVPARGALRKGAEKSPGSGSPGPTSDVDIVAASVAPQTTPLRPSNGSQPAPSAAQTPPPAKESSSPTYSLIVTLPEADNDNAAIDSMNSLKRLLAQHPGPDVVTLRIPYSPETGSVTSAQLPYGVQYSRHLESEITRLFGPASLAVIQLASR
jgi:DNA polymerase III subunit alpha